MLWGYVFAGAVGFLLGVRYSVPALLFVSLLIVLAAPVLMTWSSLALWEAIIAAVAILVVLQGSYLAGLATTLVVARRKPRDEGSLVPEDWQRAKPEAARSPQAVL
jgi:hypothetical protein